MATILSMASSKRASMAPKRSTECGGGTLAARTWLGGSTADWGNVGGRELDGKLGWRDCSDWSMHSRVSARRRTSWTLAGSLSRTRRRRLSSRASTNASKAICWTSAWPLTSASGYARGSEKENVVSKGAQRLTPLTTTGAELCPMQADAFRGEKSRLESGTQGSVVVEGGFWQAQDKTLSWTTETNQQNLPPRLIVPSVDGGGNVKVLQPGLEVVTGFAVEQLGHDERTVKGSVAIHCCEKKKLTDKAKKKKKRTAERTGRAQRSRTSHVWRQCKNVKYVCKTGSQIKLPSTLTQHDLRVWNTCSLLSLH